MVSLQFYNRYAPVCPECHTMCLRTKSLRVYLPFKAEPSAEETLVTKLKIAKHELGEVKKDFVFANQLQQLLDTKVEKSTGIINHKNKKVSELKVLVKEKENLQKKLKEMEKLYAAQTALAGTSSDVDKILTRKPPPVAIATMAVALKR